MTDQELVELVLHKPPEELSVEEIRDLRSRLGESAALREAVRGQLRLEECLAGALGVPQVSVERILVAAPNRESRATFLWGFALAVLLAAGGVAALISWGGGDREGRPADKTQLAAAEADKTPAAKTNAAAAPPAEKSPDSAATKTPAEPDAVAVAPRAAVRREIEAETFVRGAGIVVDTTQDGKGIGVVRSDNSVDGFLEYDIEVESAGPARLEIRYATGNARPMVAKINDRAIADRVGEIETGGKLPEHQQWFTIGTIDLSAGKYVLRLEAEQRFPRIDKLAITLEPGPGPAHEKLAPARQGPWEDADQLGGPVRPFAEVCFEGFPPSIAPPKDAELRRWLGPVSGKSQRYYQRDYANMRLPALDGVYQLLNPWPENAALRFSVADDHGLKLHLWRGPKGLTLHRYDSDQQGWAAYAITRANREPLPASLNLVAADEARTFRTVTSAGPYTYELRFARDLAILTRGDVVLLTAPFAGQPDEAYLETRPGGGTILRGIRMARSEPPPPPPAAPRTTIAIDKLADQKWLTQLPSGSRLDRDAGGATILADKALAEASTAAIALPKLGAWEIVCELADVQPGTGVFLGDPAGKPLYAANFFRHRRTNGMTCGIVHPQDRRIDADDDYQTVPAPLVASNVWVRWIVGSGRVAMWFSADGQNWVRTGDPWRNMNGPAASVGIQCVAGDGPRRIRLRRVELREFSALASLIPESLRDKGVAPANVATPAAWLTAVAQAKPANADPDAWRRACALRTLGSGPHNDLGRWLIDGLVRFGLESAAPLETRLRMIEEAALLAELSDSVSVTSFLRHYSRLGEALARGGEARPATLLLPSFMSVPLWTRERNLGFPARLLSAEIVRLSQDDRWSDVYDLCRRASFWGPPTAEDLGRLIEWGLASSARRLPNPPAAPTVVLRSEWRHPLLAELGKEGFNLLSELEAALGGQSYADACQILTNLGTNQDFGLLPRAKDPRLHVSLRVAVAEMLREHPRLLAVMNEKHGPVAALRVRQAIADGDAAALEAATLQFAGTPAAAEALLWLGDRATSGGDFIQALARYRQATALAVVPLRDKLAARQRLAAALVGQEAGNPVTTEVEWGETKMSAAEFERLVTDLRERRRATPAAQTGALREPFAFAAPRPSGFDAQLRGKHDGSLGDKSKEVPRGFDGLAADWTGRCLSPLVVGDTVLVSSRFEVQAYDVKSARRLWQAALGGEQDRVTAWPLHRTRPLVRDQRVHVVRLAKTGPELTCLNLANGAVVWRSRFKPAVVSDPVVLQDQLLAITRARLGDRQPYQLYLTAFDAESGEVLRSRPLIQFRDNWDSQPVCEIATHEDALLIVGGGAVICCDSGGEPRWARRQEWLPPSVDSEWVLQHQSPPLVVQDRLFVTQPGVKSLECLDPRTGALHWRWTAHDVRRLVGVVDQHVVVETEDALGGLDVATGQLVWRRPLDNILLGQLVGGPGGLLVAIAEPVSPDAAGKNNSAGKVEQRVTLVWLDPATGKETARAPLAPLHDKGDLFCGPLVPHGDRLWAFFAKNGREPDREIFELIPQGPAQPARN